MQPQDQVRRMKVESGNQRRTSTRHTGAEPRGCCRVGALGKPRLPARQEWPFPFIPRGPPGAGASTDLPRKPCTSPHGGKQAWRKHSQVFTGRLSHGGIKGFYTSRVFPFFHTEHVLVM